MPLVTFFSVLEQPGKNRKGVVTTPPLVRRGLTLFFFYVNIEVTIESKKMTGLYHVQEGACTMPCSTIEVGNSAL